MQLALVWSEPVVGVSAAALPSGRAGAGARGRWRAREAARTALVSSLGTSASAMAQKALCFAAGLGAVGKGEKDGTKINLSCLPTHSVTSSLQNIRFGFALIQWCPLPPCRPVP